MGEAGNLRKVVLLVDTLVYSLYPLVNERIQEGGGGPLEELFGSETLGVLVFDLRPDISGDSSSISLCVSGTAWDTDVAGE